MAKNGQKWSKNGQKSDGGAQKNPKKYQKIKKMAKNSPTEPRVIALKRVKMH